MTSLGKDGAAVFSYDLEDVFVESSQVSGSNGDELPTESLSLAYERIRFAVGPSTFAWDVAANKTQ